MIMAGKFQSLTMASNDHGWKSPVFNDGVLKTVFNSRAFMYRNVKLCKQFHGYNEWKLRLKVQIADDIGSDTKARRVGVQMVDIGPNTHARSAGRRY